jgi:integrase
LDVLAEEPKQIERSARIGKIDCTIEYIKQNLSYRPNKPDKFLDVMDEFIRIESTANSWTAGTEKRWKHLKSNLEKFNKKYKLEFDSINDSFANSFIETQVKNGWGNVTTKKALQMTIQFVRWANKHKYHTATAYRDIEIKIKQQKKETNVVYLTLDEIAQVNQLTFTEDESRYEKARDVFLFSCFTGLRHSDLIKLKRSSIKGENLVLTSQKTEDSINVSLTDQAKAILEKYKDSGDINPIPVISQQKYNQYLKHIGFKAELFEEITQIHYKGRERIETTLPKWQLLTTHIGRKTFVTLAVFLNIPLETVAKITGHKSDSIEEAYYRILDSKKTVEMQKFNNLKIAK